MEDGVAGRSASPSSEGAGRSQPQAGELPCSLFALSAFFAVNAGGQPQPCELPCSLPSASLTSCSCSCSCSLSGEPLCSLPSAFSQRSGMKPTDTAFKNLPL